MLAYYFNGAALPPISLVYVALHNANPGADGTQSTNETAYSNYARVARPSSPGSWTVASGNPSSAQNIQPVVFPACGALGDVVNFWSVGLSATGPGQIINSGPIGTGTAYGFSATLNGAIYVPLLPAGIVVNALVAAYQFGPGMLLPNGLNEGQTYYAGTVNGNILTLSTSPNNAAPLAFGSIGSGILTPVLPLVITPNVTPTFPPNSINIYRD